ncbi:hypothetical protein TNCV_2826541 [Trichonephila clavipes]|nr:hypothetical protein TNCV_2826541 [Trichonephila clavipes]
MASVSFLPPTYLGAQERGWKAPGFHHDGHPGHPLGRQASDRRVRPRARQCQLSALQLQLQGSGAVLPSIHTLTNEMDTDRSSDSDLMKVALESILFLQISSCSPKNWPFAMDTGPVDIFGSEQVYNLDKETRNSPQLTHTDADVNSPPIQLKRNVKNPGKGKISKSCNSCVSAEADFVDQSARKVYACRISGREIRISNRFLIIPGTLPDSAGQPYFRHIMAGAYLKSLKARTLGP